MLHIYIYSIYNAFNNTLIIYSLFEIHFMSSKKRVGYLYNSNPLPSYNPSSYIYRQHRFILLRRATPNEAHSHKDGTSTYSKLRFIS